MIWLKYSPEPFFWAKNLFPLLPSAKNRTERSFLSACARLIRLNFFFSSLISFSSAASYSFIAFLFFACLLTLAVTSSLPAGCSRIGIRVSDTSGPLKLSLSLHWVRNVMALWYDLARVRGFHASSILLTAS